MVEKIKNDYGEVFVIGGASIYKQCVDIYPDKLNKLYITEIDDNWNVNKDSKYFDYSSLENISIIKRKNRKKGSIVFMMKNMTVIL